MVSIDSDASRVSDEVQEQLTKAEAKGRRWWLWIGLLVVAAVAVGTIFLLGSRDQETDAGATPVNTAEVVRTDLADETTFDATLGRPEAQQVTAGLSGTVTYVPEAGTVIGSGDALFAIDDRPVLLIPGEVPMYRAFRLGKDDFVVVAARSGVVTWLSEVGTILESGSVVARIDEEPIVALHGDLPLYRTLREGVDGADTRQLEQALVDLGYDPDGKVTVDEEFTVATEAMVERWQEDLGVDETGRVEAGAVVFVSLPGQVSSLQAASGSSVGPTAQLVSVTAGEPLSGSDVRQLEQALVTLGYGPGPVDGVYDADTARAVAAWTADGGHGESGTLPVGSIVFGDGGLRVNEVLAEVGTAVSPATPIVSAASLDTIVKLDLPAEDQDLLDVGASVVVVMPDRSETTGTVTFVASVATSGNPGEPATFDVEIALDDPSVAAGLDEAPVDVIAVSETVEGVVAVPVSALLALAEGGYAVELVEGDTTHLVAVEPGFFAEGLVEITGPVQPGDIVVVP